MGETVTTHLSFVTEIGDISTMPSEYLVAVHVAEQRTILTERGQTGWRGLRGCRIAGTKGANCWNQANG